MGTMLMNAGRSDAAEAQWQEALRRFRDIYGRTDRDTIIALGRLASSMAAQGRYAQARQLLAEARAEVTQRPGPDTAGALATITARQLECEMAHGDLKAAARLATLVDPATSKLPSAGDMIVSVVTKAEVMRRLGRPEQSLAHVESWLHEMPATARDGPEAFQATPALIEGRLASGATSAATTQIGALLATMRQQQATRTWLYRETTELAALSLADRGLAAAAVEMLNALDRDQQSAALQPASRVQRADSAMRRARVLSAAGRRQDAAAAAKSLEGDLIDQHPQSARLQAAIELRSALGL